MKILVDMNLSPLWRETFEQEGIKALHWSEVGNPKAKDREI
jgi:predicted nuclease of predicted toxin-antitoxin system